MKHLCPTVPLPNIGPHFPIDAIIENSCGLKDKIVRTKLSAHLIIMPITAPNPGRGGFELEDTEEAQFYPL